jgi:hypothetical protein
MTGKVYRNHGCRNPIARYLLSLHIFIGDTAPGDIACCQAVAELQDGEPHVPLTRMSRPSSYGWHQGSLIPWSEFHKTMISEGYGGPARTRIWDQGIMRNSDSLFYVRKQKNCRRFFAVPSFRRTRPNRDVTRAGPKWLIFH